jgi:putative FmdB family regulatory protein
MPIYGYRCESCGFEKDFLQKVGDAPLVDCPECGQPSLRKQLSAAGFQLKGSGWYATDFKGGSKSSPAAKAEGKSDSGADAKGDGKKSESSTTSSSSGAGGAAGQ